VPILVVAGGRPTCLVQLAGGTIAGQLHPGWLREDGFDMSVFTRVTPSYPEVLGVRARRVAMVRDFLAAVTPDVLAAPRANPHDPRRQVTVLSCLHVILNEERGASPLCSP
jgi:DinB superfamily